MVQRIATGRLPYRYTFSGLPNVFLCGITVYHCPTCRSEAPMIPKVGQLHRVMADVISRNPTRLRGAEIRFLRKNIGVSSRELAQALAIAPETLSRAENDKMAFPATAERTLRILARYAAASESARDAVLELAGITVATKRKESATPGMCKFRLVKGENWRAAA